MYRYLTNELCLTTKEGGELFYRSWAQILINFIMIVLLPLTQDLGKMKSKITDGMLLYTGDGFKPYDLFY